MITAIAGVTKGRDNVGTEGAATKRIYYEPVFGRQVEYGSVRHCDFCGAYVPFDNPDADVRVCLNCEDRGD